LAVAKKFVTLQRKKRGGSAWTLLFVLFSNREAFIHHMLVLCFCFSVFFFFLLFLEDRMKRDRAIREHRGISPLPGVIHDHVAIFRRVAESVLHEKLLVAGNKTFRPVECEVYFRGADFDDMFAHADPQQKICGSFYFHKTGKSFRGGNYKGSVWKGFCVVISK
jgi:hypothetical protein